MVAIRDFPKVQQRGSVFVGWGVADMKGTDNDDSYWKVPKFNQGSPLRVSALHMCYTNEVWKDRLAMMQLALNTQLQVRVRLH